MDCYTIFNRIFLPSLDLGQKKYENINGKNEVGIIVTFYAIMKMVYEYNVCLEKGKSLGRLTTGFKLNITPSKFNSIHLFLQQAPIEHLLCVQPCTSCFGKSDKIST